MAVEIKAGVWKRRDGKVTIVLGRGPGGFWQCSDGSARFDDGRSWSDRNDPEDLVEWIDVLEGPGQPQPDAAEEHRQTELNELSAELETIRDVCDGLSENLAELREDRDRWQTRAVQAEGRVKTLTQDLMRKHDELVAARQQLQDRDAADQVPGNEQLRQQITQLIAEREELSQQTRCEIGRAHV